MDPYKVLGVSYDASDSEIKTKYRELSRKYHPDANIGKPNQKELEEKFKEVQQAYTAIMDERQGKTTTNSGYNYGYGSSTGYENESQDDVYIRSAASYIQRGYYREGLNVLNSVKDKTAVWYYYSAWANYQLDNNAVALEHAKMACNLEPGNMYYRELYNEISNGESMYQRRSGMYGGNPSQEGYSVGSVMNLCGRVAFCICASMVCGGGRFGIPIMCCI